MRTRHRSEHHSISSLASVQSSGDGTMINSMALLQALQVFPNLDRTFDLTASRPKDAKDRAAGQYEIAEIIYQKGPRHQPCELLERSQSTYGDNAGENDA